jgi:hypothetical protein
VQRLSEVQKQAINLNRALLALYNKKVAYARACVL